MLLGRHISILLLTFGLSAVSASGQTIRFGSADRLDERLTKNWWESERVIHALGGISLIGAQWRASGRVTSDWVLPPVTVRLDGSVRLGPLGTYEPDWDELYDLVRLLAFARYAPRDKPVHARVGLIDRVQLGAGHVVNFFGSSAAWDERTVGSEFIWAGRTIEVAGFSDNVLADGVLGGRVALRPVSRSDELALSSLQLGVNYAHDRRTTLDAWNLDARFDLFSSGDVFFAPFVSYAWYPGYGEGLFVGATLYADQFIDLFSFHLRMGAFYNGKQFIPGYFNSFYPVNNLTGRIVRSGADLENIQPDDLVGIPLAKGRGGNDLLTELQLTIQPNFSFWYYMRHYFGAQRLSEFHLRLFWQSGNTFQIALGMDKTGKGGLISFFHALDDQSMLVFRSDYRLAGPFFVYLHARYGYERITGNEEAARFLVQRRFEPYLGMRVSL